MSVWVCVCVQADFDSSVFFSHSALCFLRHSLSTESQAHQSDKLAGLASPRDPLSPAPQHWNYRPTSPCPGFYIGSEEPARVLMPGEQALSPLGRLLSPSAFLSNNTSTGRTHDSNMIEAKAEDEHPGGTTAYFRINTLFKYYKIIT